MKSRKKAIFILFMISILCLAGCATEAKEVTSTEQDKDSSSSYQYDKTNNDFFWIPDKSGNYVTQSGITLTKEELENLRLYLWDATIASMPQDVYNHQKEYKGHGGFSMKENLITDNFIYSKEEASILERDDIVARAKEELSNAAFPSDGFQYIDVTKADYDKTEDVWRITCTILKGDGEQFIAYITGKGKTMYLIYTTSMH